MMGVVPLEYLNGDTAESLGLNGEETFDIFLPEEPEVQQLIDVIAKKADGTEIRFTTRLRFDAPADIRYWKNQGILPMVIRKKMA
jgi:aconitate hydratase